MAQIIAYVRVSTNKQDIDNQIFEIERFCKERGFVVDSFENDVITGTSEIKNRKFSVVYNKLGKGDTLIVTEMTRLSRKMLDLMETIKHCLDKGITIYSIKENYKLSDDPQSKFLAAAFGMVAEIERNLISQRTKSALDRKRSEGVILGRKVGSKNNMKFRSAYKYHDEIVRLAGKDIPESKIAIKLKIDRSVLHRYMVDIGMHKPRKKGVYCGPSKIYGENSPET